MGVFCGKIRTAKTAKIALMLNDEAAAELVRAACFSAIGTRVESLHEFGVVRVEIGFRHGGETRKCRFFVRLFFLSVVDFSLAPDFFGDRRCSFFCLLAGGSRTRLQQGRIRRPSRRRWCCSRGRKTQIAEILDRRHLSCLDGAVAVFIDRARFRLAALTIAGALRSLVLDLFSLAFASALLAPFSRGQPSHLQSIRWLRVEWDAASLPVVKH